MEVGRREREVFGFVEWTEERGAKAGEQVTGRRKRHASHGKEEEDVAHRVM